MTHFPYLIAGSGIYISSRPTLLDHVLLWARNIARPGIPIQKRKELFDTILQDYDDLISRLCFGYARTREEYEDLRQDTYANIWKGLGSFRGEASPSTWVYRVTLNTCVSTIRKRQQRGISITLSEVADLADSSPQAYEELSELYEYIGSLDPFNRAVVMLWLDSLTYEEIAHTLGMSRNAVATRLHRVKNKLKTIMKQ